MCQLWHKYSYHVGMWPTNIQFYSTLLTLMQATIRVTNYQHLVSSISYIVCTNEWNIILASLLTHQLMKFCKIMCLQVELGGIIKMETVRYTYGGIAKYHGIIKYHDIVIIVSCSYIRLRSIVITMISTSARDIRNWHYL